MSRKHGLRLKKTGFCPKKLISFGKDRLSPCEFYIPLRQIDNGLENYVFD